MRWPSAKWTALLSGLRQCAIALCIAYAASAKAQVRPELELDWRAPAICPGSEYVLQHVASALEGTQAEGRGVSARGVVTALSGNRFRVALEVNGPSVQVARAFEGSTCESVAQAAALVIALTIDPNAGTDTTPAAEPAPEPVQTEPPEIEQRAPVAIREVPAKMRARFGVGLAGAVDYGTLPKPAPGAELLVSYESVLRLELAASIYVPVAGTVSDAANIGADFRLATVTFRACYPLFAGRALLGPCVSVGGDWIHASGFGSAIARSADILSGSVGAGVLGAVALSKSAGLRCSVGAAAPLARPKYAVEGLGDVHRSAAIAGRAAVGIEIDFE